MYLRSIFAIFFFLGTILSCRAEEEMERVWKEWLAKAEAGDPRFQTKVGLKYIRGNDEPGICVPDFKTDINLGWKWLERASMQGHKPAQLALSESHYFHYQMNRGTDREELILASMWYCVYKAELCTDYPRILSDESIKMTHTKVKAFWDKHPELKK